jgi:hypothetical protein
MKVVRVRRKDGSSYMAEMVADNPYIKPSAMRRHECAEMRLVRTMEHRWNRIAVMLSAGAIRRAGPELKALRGDIRSLRAMHKGMFRCS